MPCDNCVHLPSGIERNGRQVGSFELGSSTSRLLPCTGWGHNYSENRRGPDRDGTGDGSRRGTFELCDVEALARDGSGGGVGKPFDVTFTHSHTQFTEIEHICGQIAPCLIVGRVLLY